MPQAIDDVDALFDHTYLRSFHLLTSQVLVEVIETKGKVEMTLPGGVKARKPVMWFKVIQGSIEPEIDEKGKAAGWKPLVLNATNAGEITKLYGRKPSQWPGKQIVLNQTQIRMYDKEAGGMVVRDCIRVRAPKVESKES